MVLLDGQELWKEHHWYTGDKEVWERGILIDFSEWAKNMKAFVSHVNAHQRVTSAEEDFNHPLKSRCDPSRGDQSSSFCSRFCHCLVGHSGRDGGHAWAQQHGLPLTKAGLATAECPVSQEQRPTRSPNMVTNQLPGGRLITLNGFHHGRGSALFF